MEVLNVYLQGQIGQVGKIGGGVLLLARTSFIIILVIFLLINFLAVRKERIKMEAFAVSKLICLNSKVSKY